DPQRLAEALIRVASERQDAPSALNQARARLFAWPAVAGQYLSVFALAGPQSQ
ncbi:MAG: hypothetical protein H5T63_05060, partial [Chloroflexi bacterium]|nr:hypothetical protein [Chloroflexota bacterium]